MTTDRPPESAAPAPADGPLDLDALSLDAIRAGALRDRPVTVLGFARSGIALARFLVDAGARVTVYDGRPAAKLAGAVGQLDGRDVRLLVGPDVDPASAWVEAALVTTSPSINPDYPTTEPRLRAALVDLVARRAAGGRSAGRGRRTWSVPSRRHAGLHPVAEVAGDADLVGRRAQFDEPNQFRQRQVWKR